MGDVATARAPEAKPDAEPLRKPYRKPEFRFERAFETMALACGSTHRSPSAASTESRRENCFHDHRNADSRPSPTAGHSSNLLVQSPEHYDWEPDPETQTEQMPSRRKLIPA
jgi:hypothetical protein